MQHNTTQQVAKECGYDVVEMNASDNRTQKSLKQTITSTLGSRSVLSMMKKGQQKEKDIVIIMDEVGGLDRGGTTEIIAMLKQARTPLICLCNDKYHQKLKSLSNHLMDMPFSRPQKQSVATNLRKKLRECEGVDIHEQALIHVVEAAGNDLRATLNNLQMWARTSNQLTYDMVIAAQGTASKDTDMSPFAAAQQLFFSNLTIPKMESLYYGNDLLGLYETLHHLNHSFLPQSISTTPTASCRRTTYTVAGTWASIVSKRLPRCRGRSPSATQWTRWCGERTNGVSGPPLPSTPQSTPHAPWVAARCRATCRLGRDNTFPHSLGMHLHHFLTTKHPPPS